MKVLFVKFTIAATSTGISTNMIQHQKAKTSCICSETLAEFKTLTQVKALKQSVIFSGAANSGPSGLCHTLHLL